MLPQNGQGAKVGMVMVAKVLNVGINANILSRFYCAFKYLYAVEERLLRQFRVMIIDRSDKYGFHFFP